MKRRLTWLGGRRRLCALGIALGTALTAGLMSVSLLGGATPAAAAGTTHETGWAPLACLILGAVPSHIAVALTADVPNSVTPGQDFSLANTGAVQVLTPAAQEAGGAVAPGATQFEGIVSDFEENLTNATSSFNPGNPATNGPQVSPTQFNQIAALQSANADGSPWTDPYINGPSPTYGSAAGNRSSAADGATTISSVAITTVTAFFTGTDVGLSITGTNIAANTTVATVTDSTHATLSQNATATGSGIVFTIHAPAKVFSFGVIPVITGTSGTSTAVTATTLTDTSKAWAANAFVTGKLSSGSSTATVTSNTATVLTFSGGWTGGTPASGIAYAVHPPGNAYGPAPGSGGGNTVTSGTPHPINPGLFHVTGSFGQNVVIDIGDASRHVMVSGQNEVFVTDATIFFSPAATAWTGPLGVQCGVDTNQKTNATGATTNASVAITTTTASFVASDVGQPITGTNIPANTTVATVTDSTHATLSQNATGTGSGIVFTIDETVQPPAPGYCTSAPGVLPLVPAGCFVHNFTIPIPGVATEPVTQSAVSTLQYSLANSNGSTWQEIDAGNLRITNAPGANQSTLLTANADLFTGNAGFNQDLGIFVSDNGAADQLLAWKESGGFAGTYSPNAAYIQSRYDMLSGHVYVFKLKWKTNKNAPGSTIYAGAGPGPAPWSPTSLVAETFPPGVVPNFAVSTTQYSLANSNGSTWQPIDATNLVTTVAPASSSTAVLGGNADLFTGTAGYNQDIGIFVSDNGGADTLVAWKESGGFAGTYSPNAAFVKATYAMTGGHSYIFKLKWKTNKNAPGATIYAAAGPGPAPWSHTSLLAETIAAGANPYTAASVGQYSLTNSNGSLWNLMDSNLNVTVAPGANTNSIIGANVDLFTGAAGYNQDIGIFVSDNGGADTMLAWKESGGFAGTYSPNAAFSQATFGMTSGHTYVFKLKWKTNKNAPGATIYAAAGPGPSPWSNTRVTVELTN